MSENMKDIALGVVLVAIGLFALFYIQYGPGEAIQSSRDANITFRSFPVAISSLLVVISSLYVVSSLMSLSRSRKEGAGLNVDEHAEKIAPPPFLFLRILAVVAMLIGFALLIGKIPFFLLTGGFLFIAFFIFGETRVGPNAIVAVIGGGLFHGLFVSILNLPLY
ncbi:tripartite tricarboxylate transporter TctB family protein [Sneathiella sp.]|uniref:tripartite tricarboxylate transporter TctB family protein n=1 Tax=Sneathiella sp. TaxID=1964365 RepID=UPI003568C5DA